MKEKQYIIHKYVIAKSAKDAMKKEHDLDADEVYIDNDWVSKQDSDKKIGYG